MAAQGVGRRYAEAIFDLASDAGTEDDWLSALESLAAAAEDDETRAYFENPGIADQDKEKALDQILAADESEGVRNLARLLIERQRFDQLPNILEAFEEMVLRSRGIAIADVTTAISLNQQEQQHISRQLSRIVGSDVQLRLHVDDSIIGGVVARVGDQLIDGSVRTQLRELRSSLARR